MSKLLFFTFSHFSLYWKVYFFTGSHGFYWKVYFFTGSHGFLKHNAFIVSMFHVKHLVVSQARIWTPPNVLMLSIFDVLFLKWYREFINNDMSRQNIDMYGYDKKGNINITTHYSWFGEHLLVTWQVVHV